MNILECAVYVMAVRRRKKPAESDKTNLDRIPEQSKQDSSKRSGRKGSTRSVSTKRSQPKGVSDEFGFPSEDDNDLRSSEKENVEKGPEMRTPSGRRRLKSQPSDLEKDVQKRVEMTKSVGKKNIEGGSGVQMRRRRKENLKNKESIQQNDEKMRRDIDDDILSRVQKRLSGWVDDTADQKLASGGKTRNLPTPDPQSLINSTEPSSETNDALATEQVPINSMNDEIIKIRHLDSSSTPIGITKSQTAERRLTEPLSPMYSPGVSFYNRISSKIFYMIVFSYAVLLRD